MLNTICLEEYGKDLHLCSNEECFHALMKLVAQKGRDRIVKDNGRKVYYISAEFLIGKLLSNNLINLGIYDEVKEELTQAGKNLSGGLWRVSQAAPPIRGGVVRPDGRHPPGNEGGGATRAGRAGSPHGVFGHRGLGQPVYWSVWHGVGHHACLYWPG